MENIKKNPLKYFISLENRARYKLIKRYNKPLSYHDVKIINDILYNEKTHYVEQFKEYLIYEDYNEFLKRYYKSYEINLKLPKILMFYDKYSKIYANYTVIPESKYMYKNIKRKQKMIDQMQNNGINYSEYEEDEESNTEISNTVFSSRVINSIYNKTLASVNKSDNDGNTEQSISDFITKINAIENKINICRKNNKNSNDKNKKKEKMTSKENLINKNKINEKEIHLNDNKYNFNFNNINNNSFKNKINDIQFTCSKKVLQIQNDIIKNNPNNNSNNNSKLNINNNVNSKNNYTNLIFINSYVSKSKTNGSIYINNNSINNVNGNSAINNNNNNNTFNGHKNSLKTNTSFPKQKFQTTLLKQNIKNNSNNLNNYKENISLTNINNYLTNFNNISNEQKFKISLGETLLKLDKIVLSTNSSSSPKLMNENMLSPPNNKVNIFQNKKENIKDKEKKKIKKDSKNKANQALSSNKVINKKKIKSHLLGAYKYNSFGNNLTFLSNKFIENHKLKNITKKIDKKKLNKKNNKKDNLSNNNHNKENENKSNNDEQSSKIFKKPESHRNYCHSKMLSGNNSNSKNKINYSNKNNSKITVGLKQGTKYNSQKLISTPCSPTSSSTNFYFQSNVNSRKNSINNLDKNLEKTVNENKKKKVVNNFNIVNNIHDNSTQINIYTGKNLYKSLHFHNNSVFNSANITPGNTSSKSPTAPGGNIKNKKNLQGNKMSNSNTIYFKSNIKGNEKEIKYNLDLKNIINKQNNESEKVIISARQITNNRKLFEKLGKYFFKNKNEKNNLNINNKNNNHYMSNKNTNTNNSNTKKNAEKSNNKKNKHNYNDYNLLINKMINKNCNSNKVLKNKTNNNTPIKNKYTPYITKNHRKVPIIGLSPQDNDQLNQMNKASSRQNINYNKIIGNLNELKNIGIDDGAKLLIHSERNKISKIVFK
jgi:hypothetical protein